MKIRDLLEEGANELGVHLKDVEIDNFLFYLEELKLWSRKINLTGLKNDEDIIINHFIDSLTIVKYLTPGSTLLDIGTGAGFPGVPVAMVCAENFVTCMDSSLKKITFVKHVIRRLGIENLKTIAGRAGQIEIDTAGFDFVAARAVSDIKTVIKLGRPYLNEKGKIIAMRGEKGVQELDEVSEELETLGVGIDMVDEFNLPISGARRVNILFNKLV